MSKRYTAKTCTVLSLHQVTSLITGKWPCKYITAF